MVDAGPGEVMAHGQTTGAGSDDDDGRMHSRLSVEGGVVQATVTWTVVGLVMMSKTAERFWDCATMASMSAWLGSGATSNWTRMRSKPLGTSASIPRMPWRSISPCTVAVTERSWIPRLVATVATPAV